MKKKTYVLGMAMLVAALLALSGVAQSAMWVGAELGGNFNQLVNFNVSSGPFHTNTGNSEINPSVIGGVTLGYDFVNAGFGGYAYPDWMKYFSFALDLTYNRLVIQDYGPGIGRFFPVSSRGFNGYEAALTFLFMFHYGFFPDSDVPSGRVNPYIGVGPAVVWSGADVQVGALGAGHTDSTNIALVVEPGIRWVVLKNVSIDTAMRWRYSQPSYDVGNVTIKADRLSQFAFLLRANYHF